MAQTHQTVTKETAGNLSNHGVKPSSYLFTPDITNPPHLFVFVFFLNSSFILPPHHLHHATSAQHYLVHTWQWDYMNDPLPW